MGAPHVPPDEPHVQPHVADGALSDAVPSKTSVGYDVGQAGACGAGGPPDLSNTASGPVQPAGTACTQMPPLPHVGASIVGSPSLGASPTETASLPASAFPCVRYGSTKHDVTVTTPSMINPNAPMIRPTREL